MALIAAPVAGVTSADLRPWFPGQVTLTRLTGRKSTIGRGRQGWQGSFVFGPVTQAEIKNLASWLWKMQGSVNVSDIALPPAFRPVDPPEGLSAVLADWTAGTTTGTMEVTVSNAGSFRSLPGDFLSVGTRLYHVEAVSGSNYTVTPNVEPSVPNGSPVQLAKPQVRVRLEAVPGVGQIGNVYSQTRIEWTEAAITPDTSTPTL